MRSLSLLLICFSLTSWSQTYYQNGQANKSAMKDLITERGYQLVASFDTISYNPDKVVAVYYKDSLMGLLDASGKELTPAIYQRIPSLELSGSRRKANHKLLIVMRGGYYGLLNLDGKEVVKPTYQYITYAAIPSSDNGQVDENRYQIINGQKVYIKEIGFEAVVQWDSTHILDAKGRFLSIQKEELDAEMEIMEEYDEFGLEENGHGRASHSARPSVPNYGRVWSSSAYPFIAYKNHNSKKCGVINVHTHDTIIPFVYDNISFNYRTQARLNIWDSVVNNRITSQRWGMADTNGNVLFEPVYEKLYRFNDVYQLTKNGKMALYGLDFKPLSDFEYDPDMGSGNGHFMVLKKETGAGLVNMQGEALTSFDYEGFRFPEDHDLPYPLVVAIKNGREALMSFDGVFLTGSDYSVIYAECNIETGKNHPYMGAGSFISNTPNRYFIVGKTIGEEDYRGMKYHYGIMDTNYQEAIACLYDQLLTSSDPEIVLVQSNSWWGVLYWETEEFIVPLTETSGIESYYGGYFMYARNGLFGMVNKQGVEVVPFKENKPFKTELFMPGLRRIYTYAGFSALLDEYGNRLQTGKANPNYRPYVPSYNIDDMMDDF